MRKIYKMLIIFTLLLSIALSACAKDVEGLVAMVNDEGITEEEFDTEFQFYRQSYERQLGEDALTEVGSDGRTLESKIKENVLNTLIVEKLIMQDAETKNISVSQEEVDERIEEIIENIGGEEQFNEFLQSNGMTMEYFEDFTRKDILFSKHNKEFQDSIEISEDEAEDYFNQYKDDLVIVRASHILLSTEEEGQKVLDALEKGESFEELAIRESKDSQSAINGGDLGYFSRGKFAAVQEFEKAVFELEEGEISDLVKTEVGYHIIRLDERMDTFEELKDEIILKLKDQSYTRYIEELMDKGKIKVYIEIR